MHDLDIAGGNVPVKFLNPQVASLETHSTTDATGSTNTTAFGLYPKLTPKRW